MDFLSTIVLAAAAFFGLSELTTLFGWSGDGALEAAATVVGTEYPEAAALVASTTEAVQSAVGSVPAW